MLDFAGLRKLAFAFGPSALLVAAGCKTIPPAPTRTTVADHLVQRVGYTLPCKTVPGQLALPPGASLDDGLTEDEAVVIALWNNAAFQEVLVDLGLTRGDLIQAGLLPNPEVLMYFAVPDKPFRYLFDFALDSLWLRPIRVRSAAREADRTADRLAQAGLDLMRDTRQAYADVLLAKDRVRVVQETADFRRRVADLAGKRLKAGDISPQEEATARIDSLRADQDLARVAYDIPVFEERLRNLLGLGACRIELSIEALPPPACVAFDPEQLSQDAMRYRPDALAATEAVAAAEARIKFAKLSWVRFLGIADATSGRRNGNELGPGLRVTLPIFNRNEGNIIRAEGELERAVRNQKTLQYQIIMDVHRAHLQYRQTCTELEFLKSKVSPEVEAAIRRAQAAYQEGNVTYLIVLETTRQLLDNHLREAQLNSDLRRFYAELERSVGRRLGGSAPGAAPVVTPGVAPPVPPNDPEDDAKIQKVSAAGVPGDAPKALKLSAKSAQRALSLRDAL